MKGEDIKVGDEFLIKLKTDDTWSEVECFAEAGYRLNNEVVILAGSPRVNCEPRATWFLVDKCDFKENKMKTIEDAYEDLNGDLNNTYFWDAATDDKYLFFKEGHIGYICDNSRETEEGAYQYICTVEEFNNYKPAKTTLDAVIATKGKLPHNTKYIYIKKGSDRDRTLLRSFYCSSLVSTSRLLVCTADKFNTLVDELASNFGECDISYQKHCSNEVTRLEGDEMKTETHEGNIYQIGGSYEFSDDGAEWLLGTLSGCTTKETNGTKYPFQCEHDSKVEWFKRIRLQQTPVGTITEAPVELVDGECYQFDYGIEAAFKGTYDKKDGCFWVKDSALLTEQCTNIKPLTVAK